MRRWLAGKPALEGRRRVERVLERLAAPVERFDWLRELRAVELRERIE